MPTNFPTSVDVLTNPVSNDSLNSPSHSAQHANANDAIEAIETVLVPAVNAWTAWSPVLSNGWANGNGTWTARYVQIGKTIHVSAYFIIGSTTTKGAGADLTLPVSAFNSAMQVNGNIYCSIAGNLYPLGFVSKTGTTIAIKTIVTNGVYGVFNDLTGTTPATFNTNDVIYVGLTYEAA